MSKEPDMLNVHTKSTAQVIDNRRVEVTAQDGEVFTVLCRIGELTTQRQQDEELKWLEITFDQFFSDNKEQMIDSIWQHTLQFGIGFGVLGISSGTRHSDRARIGARIKEIRDHRGIEARDLASITGIDPGNLSRIENGRYSVGLDILCKLATALGKKVDFVDL